MLNKNNLLYSTAAIRELEQLAIKSYGISATTLMQRAGAAVFRELKKRWPEAQKIAVVCGKGNNAGDGYVVARLAQSAGLKVSLLTSTDNLTGTAGEMANLCKQIQIPTTSFTLEQLMTADVIVDALLGIGLVGEVNENYKTVIAAINQSKKPVLAIDIPSGLNANTGQILGVAVKANLTVTFIALKPGLFTADAGDCCGEVVNDDLDLPLEIFSQISANAKLLSLETLANFLPSRKKNTHKGDFGQVLIVGGDYGMSGAVRLAGEAAARVGAGLVSIATREEHALALNLTRPELMIYGIKKASQLDKLIKRATVIVLGPGLDQSNWAKSLWQEVIASGKPLVIDADGLNLLAQKTRKKHLNKNWILTPHPKEAARLLGIDHITIQQDRFAAVKLLYEYYRCICVLKGSGTLVKGEEAEIGVCALGNPGMASGGMGDVLSGIIAGLVAQNLPLLMAAELGVFIHAVAGDLAAASGERGLLASDLLPHLRKLVNFL